MENLEKPTQQGFSDVTRPNSSTAIRPISPHSRRFLFHTARRPLSSPKAAGLHSLTPDETESMPRTLTAVSDAPRSTVPSLSARVSVSIESGPPELLEIHAPGPGELLEELFSAVAGMAVVPVIALREIIENLVHARFRGIVASILDSGRLVRISDSGPGITDPERALQYGYTSATDTDRELIRGVGSGLPLATQAMDDAGGVLTLDENLGGGAVFALHTPGAAPREPAPSTPPGAQAALALLLEMGSAGPRELSDELGCSIPSCGRDLVLLEHRGLVARESNGNRRLTESGAAMIATLF